MRKLYLKLVAAIWIVMLVTTVGVAIVVNVVLPDPGERARHSVTVNPLAAFAERAVAATRGSGREGLVDWIGERARRHAGVPPLALLDEAGNVLAGPPPQALREGGGSGSSAPALPSVSFTHDGERYRLVAHGPPRLFLKQSFLPPMLGRGMLIALRPPSVWLLLLVAVPLSVGLSIAIARYLVRPLRAIEDAGRRLSEGDLSARVGSALGNRGDEIADFATAFDRMAARIESLVRSHKELLRDVSHELRSPLARAHAALSLARQRTSGAVDNELDRLEGEIERLDTMIGKLLTFSRLDSDDRDVSREPVDLAALLAEVVEDCRFEARSNEKNVVLAAEDAPVTAGDPQLLASCFENVIRNGLRHTRTGTAVEISLRRYPESSQYCCIQVRDHGPGVSEPELDRIFEPFYRADAAASEGHSGIGLAIARRAVLLHGGTIRASNAPDGGLIVTISLPVSDGPDGS